jgi:uncharacterized protein (DUF1697 family)
VETYIQSGNLVFSAAGEPEALEARLEKGIDERFGLDVPVIVRTAAQWAGYAKANPFPEAAASEPKALQLLVSKRPPDKAAAEKLTERAQAGETVKAAGGALWFHFPEGVARSKLTPALIDKACGSPSTSRNWRTVLKLKEMAE